MATVPSSLSKERAEARRFTVSEGPDYPALWRKLEARVLEIRSSTSDAICVENDPSKIKVLQGTWGAYGLIYNEMQRLLGEARGTPPTES